MNKLAHWFLFGTTLAKRHPMQAVIVLAALFFVGNLSTMLAVLLTLVGLTEQRRLVQYLDLLWIRLAAVAVAVALGWKKVAWVLALWTVLDWLVPERGFFAVKSTGEAAGEADTPALSEEEQLAVNLSTDAGFWSAWWSKNF